MFKNRLAGFNANLFLSAYIWDMYHYYLLRRLIMNAKTISIIILTIFITILSIQNLHSVTINILFWKPECSLLLLIIIATSIGFIAGLFARSMAKIAMKNKNDSENQ